MSLKRKQTFAPFVALVAQTNECDHPLARGFQTLATCCKRNSFNTLKSIHDKFALTEGYSATDNELIIMHEL